MAPLGRATSKVGKVEPMTALEEAERAGIDLSLIDVSLGYSYDKRAHQHQAALELALELERVGRQLRDAAQPIDPRHHYQSRAR
jgi:hypothetical protein